MSRRRRLLFLAEGVTMTHVARPASLAERLDPQEWEVFFRAPRRYHRLLPRTFAGLDDLATIDPEAFLAALARGGIAYDAETLRRYVRDDLTMISAVRPDLVIGDFRLSLCISAPVAGVPFASIFNAQWSPYRRQPAIVPQLPLTRWLPPGALRPLFAALKPLVYASHAMPVNDIRRAYGLPALARDIRAVYTAGDLVLYPDVPDLAPIERLPGHHHYIGPCPWSAPVDEPAWWSAAMRSPRPKVFVSLGSSGPLAALPAVLAALATLPVEVLLATSGRDVGAVPANVRVAELLPYDQTARRCALVVSHGGTGGLYPTLAAGTPMLAIPANVDMHLSTALLERSGAGLGVRVEHATVERLRAAAARILGEPSFAHAARACAAAIAAHPSHELFPRVIERFLAAREQRSADPVGAAVDSACAESWA